MWPRKLDLNPDECNSMLRQIELDCYSSVITAFRAQGGLDDLKSKILADLRKIFHIDDDRHKAEARRAANDEELTTIADQVFGESAYTEWSNEGRRTKAVLPRVAPKTAFCKLSNNVKDHATNINTTLPYPSDTRVPLEQREFDKNLPVDQKPIVTDEMFTPPPMKNALLPLDDKRFLKRCSEFDKLFRDTRQVLKKQEEAGNELATPPPKRPKTKTPRASKKLKSPTPQPSPTALPIGSPPIPTPDGISPLSPEKVVKKTAATSAKKPKTTKRAAKPNKQQQQPVIPLPPIIPTEFDTIVKNTDTVIMPPPPTPPPLPLITPSTVPPLVHIPIKKEISRNYTKLYPAAVSNLKPLTIQPSLPQALQKFTTNPIHSPPSIINISSPKSATTPNIIEGPKVIPIPGTSFAQASASAVKLKSQIVLNNLKYGTGDNIGKFKLLSAGNGKVCIRVDSSPAKPATKQKINIQKVQIIKPPHNSPVMMGKSIFTTGNKPISIVKNPKFLTSNIKQASNSTNSNVIVLGSMPSPSTENQPSPSTSSINIINEDTPVDILSAPIEIADGDDGDSMNNHSSAIVGVTDWEMELDQETNKSKSVEVSEMYSMEEESAEIVEYEGDDSFNDVIVEEDDEEETIIVDDGVTTTTDRDFNKTSEEYATPHQKPLDRIISSNHSHKLNTTEEAEIVEVIARNHKLSESETIQEVSSQAPQVTTTITTLTTTTKSVTEQQHKVTTPQDDNAMIVDSEPESNANSSTITTPTTSVTFSPSGAVLESSIQSDCVK